MGVRIKLWKIAAWHGAQAWLSEYSAPNAQSGRVIRNAKERNNPKSISPARLSGGSPVKIT
jgi:hypothetical protein